MSTLRLFASAREAAGTARAEIEATTVAELLDKARGQFGERFGRVLDTSRVWVNGQPAEMGMRIAGHDIVAVLPPVSGGSSPADTAARAAPSLGDPLPPGSPGPGARGSAVPPTSRSGSPGPPTTAGPPTAGLPTASLPTASLPTASLPTASQPTASPPTAGSPTASLPTAAPPDASAGPSDASAAGPPAEGAGPWEAPPESIRPIRPLRPVRRLRLVPPPPPDPAELDRFDPEGPSNPYLSEPPPASVGGSMGRLALAPMPDPQPLPVPPPALAPTPLPSALPVPTPMGQQAAAAPEAVPVTAPVPEAKPAAPLAVVHQSTRPHGRLGVAWAIVTAGVLFAGPGWLSVWMAVIAFVAASQAASVWRKRGERPLPAFAAAAAAALPLAAATGLDHMNMVVVGAIMLTMVARVAAPTKAPGRDVAITLVIGLSVGMAAAAPVLLRSINIPAALYLLACAALYDAGAYLVGTGASSAWEGPAAGVVAILPLTMAAAVVLVPPFHGGSPLLLGALAAVLAPFGPVAGSALLGDRTAYAPALRRLDSLLVMGPIWAWCAAALLT